MAGIFDWFAARGRRKVAVEDWRRFIITKARDVTPYAQGWVSDTMEGRSQMVALVTTIVLRRLRSIGSHDPKLGQMLYHAIFDSFDAALREDGVGDASIARRMRKIGEEFVGLARAFDGALETENASEVEGVLVKNGVCSASHSAALAAWLAALQVDLSTIEENDLLYGRIAATLSPDESP